MQKLKLSRGKILNIYPGTGTSTTTGWNPVSTGVNGFVFSIAQDMSTNLVYAGGKFSTAGGLSAGRIASWNGSSWAYLGGGVSLSFLPANTAVNAIAVASDGKVYVGGLFDTAGGAGGFSNLAVWNPATSTWSNMGGGANGEVYSIAVSGSDVYVGGLFTSVGTGGGTVAANRIAKWNGSVWSALGSGTDTGVNAIAISGSNVYAGGSFVTAGGVAANRIAVWNGSAWSALGTGLNGLCRAIAIGSGNDIYIGGNFNTAGGVSAIGIAKYNTGTSTYSSIGNLLASGATDGVTYGMYFISGNLYVCGNFVSAGGTTTTNFAIYNGTSWSTLPGVTFDSVSWTIRVDNNSNIYVGGEFTSPQAYITIYGQTTVAGSSTAAVGRDTKNFSKRIGLRF